jgi:drug/metabolite transporter (DMT)-like permease
MDRHLTPRALAVFALALVIAGNAAGNIFLKLGANAARQRPAILGVINWQTVLGVGCFAFGILAYAWALRQFELHNAQIILSLQYVVVILLAGWLLREQISTMQWLGIACIAIGLFFCTR